METSKRNLLSVVIPVFNEEGNVDAFYKDLKAELTSLERFDHEIIYVDDGSTDESAALILKLAQKDKAIRLVKLSRNFGKEIATTAGLHKSKGDAAMMIDADGQHPVNLIPLFIKKWQQNNKLVIGVRVENSKEGIVKKLGSKLFYKLFNSTSGTRLIPGSTDFRLIDKSLLRDFCKLTEHNRITRGLIDWLGYKPEIVEFKANPRSGGEPGYKISKLFKLALTSLLSLSFKPLYAIGYLGIIITPLSAIIGLALFIEDVVLKDPLGLAVTGSGYLGIILVFLVGLMLIAQGLIAVYVSYIYEEVRNRPLYVVDQDGSVL